MSSSSFFSSSPEVHFPQIPGFAWWVGLLYATVLAVGGAVGYAKRGSRASLIAGFVSAAFAAACLRVMGRFGLIGLAALSSVLTTFFYQRYLPARKFMPAGFMAFFSFITFLTFTVAIIFG